MLHHRRSIRLPFIEYKGGGYFITICSFEHCCHFGRVITNNQVELTSIGQIIERELLKTEEICKEVSIDQYVIMPNHIHAIIAVGAYGIRPQEETRSFESPSRSIGSVIRGFKATVTKQVRKFENSATLQVWQRNYYEHVIRNEIDLNKIREYIFFNPLQWEFDEMNPDKTT